MADASQVDGMIEIMRSELRFRDVAASLPSDMTAATLQTGPLAGIAALCLVFHRFRARMRQRLSATSKESP